MRGNNITYSLFMRIILAETENSIFRIYSPNIIRGADQRQGPISNKLKANEDNNTYLLHFPTESSFLIEMQASSNR